MALAHRPSRIFSVSRSPVGLISAAHAVWLASLPLITFMTPGQVELFSGVVFCVAVSVTALGLFLTPPVFPTSEKVYAYIFLFGLCILLSHLFGNFENATISDSIIRPSVMITMLFIAASLAYNVELFTQVMRIYAVLVSAVLLLVCTTGEYVWGRLTGGGAPNYWGMIALSAALAGLFIDRKLVRYSVLATAALTLYLANSRGSILALVCGLLALGWLTLSSVRSNRRINLALIMLIGITAIVILEISTGWISDEILRLDDPRRGSESGFGRINLWYSGLTLAMERPWFGSGYRKTEIFSEAFGATSAHNGYITLLIETGLFSLLFYLTFIAHALVNGYRLRKSLPHLYSTIFVIGYAILGMFERFALNSGQPLSILFLVCAFFLIHPRVAQSQVNQRSHRQWPHGIH